MSLRKYLQACIKKYLGFTQRKNTNPLKKRFPTPDFKPKVGLILGSGLASIAERISNPWIIPYNEIPGFPSSHIIGHPGQVWLGYLGIGVPIVCYQGRIHRYEGRCATDFKVFIRSLKQAGCETLILTNAAASLKTEWPPGQLVLIQDHLNLQASNPLAGPNDEEFGPRFFSMQNAYDVKLRQLFLKNAQKLKIDLAEGVYASILGPNFETPAEIRALRTLGADLVGMSTVPEVLVARHCGLRVVAISAVTNLAADITHKPITHEETLEIGQLAVQRLSRLIIDCLNHLPETLDS